MKISGLSIGMAPSRARGEGAASLSLPRGANPGMKWAPYTKLHRIRWADADRGNARPRARVLGPNVATIRFALKRLVAQRLLALAIIVTLAFSIGVLVAGPIYADSARGAILSSELRSQDTASKNIRFTVFGSATFDFGRANRDSKTAVDALPVARIIPQALSGFSLKVAGRKTDVPVLFRDGAGSQLGLRGRPPTRLTDIVISSGTARVLGLHVGDTVTAVTEGHSERLSISGIYVQPPHRASGFWFGSLNPFPGPDSIQPLPTVMDQAGYLAMTKRLGLTSQFSWDVYLASGSMTFEQAVQA